MAMCYDGALVMPSSYALMEQDDMTYMEGGGVPRGAAAMILDAAFCATPIGAVFAPFKFMGKTAARALLKKYVGQIAGLLRKAVNLVCGFIGSASVNMPVSRLMGIVDSAVGCCTSLGGIISLALDSIDSQGTNGWIGGKGFLNFSW